VRWLFFFFAFALNAHSQEKNETRELVGHLGGRAALATLYLLSQPDGSARITGEYILLGTLQQRYVEGERSKQLGVTFLRESSSQILYGRPAGPTLQGLWSGAVLKGSRYGAAGQQREQFEFSENFPSLDGYSAEVRCEALSYAVAGGRLKSFEWRAPACQLDGLAQQPFKGGLRFGVDGCSVTLREAGEFIKVAADGCERQCKGVPEPLLVDRKGACVPLRSQAR
jgi:hypothetical protein